VGWVGVLSAAWFEAASMGSGDWRSAVRQLRPLLGSTHYGHAWLVGLVAWGAAAVALLGAVGAARRLAGLALVGVFAVTRSVVSHAGAQGDFTLDVAMDGIHLVLVCAWVGIVVAGACLRLPDEASGLPERHAAVRWIASMSSTATVVLACIVATGLFKVGRGLSAVGSLGAYVGSDYGRALVAKVLLVGMAVVLGGFNRFVVLPRLLPSLSSGRDIGWRRALVMTLRLELALLCLALVAAAILGSTELPDAS
jgi:putative copper resistance protein D